MTPTCLFCTGLARDVDHVITTAEVGKVFVERGIKLNELPESNFDNPVGEGTGGAVLFGTTGGVMEAALRTVYELVSRAIIRSPQSPSCTNRSSRSSLLTNTCLLL